MSSVENKDEVKHRQGSHSQSIGGNPYSDRIELAQDSTTRTKTTLFLVNLWFNYQTLFSMGSVPRVTQIISHRAVHVHWLEIYNILGPDCTGGHPVCSFWLVYWNCTALLHLPAAMTQRTDQTVNTGTHFGGLEFEIQQQWEYEDL